MNFQIVERLLNELFPQFFLEKAQVILWFLRICGGCRLIITEIVHFEKIDFVTSLLCLSFCVALKYFGRPACACERFLDQSLFRI
ncbi:hypothetical protein FGO68_gene947 [Halteria grandinella]|uniref:Uncharacterized protein n=1 Tax=Halteria grandinella TaxID=5974 RepID=A0A8J8NEV3_HALGN|nr:hypothetical protein FGO68_gene947 [Halteria grandinella]